MRMNWFRIALKNIKKFFGDYLIYFVTLVIGVAIFYMFNSISDHVVMGELSAAGINVLELLNVVMEIASIAVAFVLGFLIVYANHFLIRRRKEEFGVYLLLGMGKREVSGILFCEILIAGGISLIIGLAVGILGAQFLATIVAGFFDADQYVVRFVVSRGAMLKTMINYTIMYGVVLVFHAVTISRYQLIDLLSANKKMGKRLGVHPVIAVIVFLLSLAVLINAYYMVVVHAKEINAEQLLLAILMGIVSNFGIFWSISGFLLELFGRMKNFYFRGLNSFVIRQLCRSIHSSVAAMGLICLLLFVTVEGLAVGLSVSKELQQTIRTKLPVDFSIRGNREEPVSKLLEEVGYPLRDWASEECVEIPVYESEQMDYVTVFGEVMEEARQQYPFASFWMFTVEFLAESDYNRLTKLYGTPHIELEEDEYAVVAETLLLKDDWNKVCRLGVPIECGEMQLHPATDHAMKGFLELRGISLDFGFIVVPDKVLSEEACGWRKKAWICAGNYATADKKEKRMTDLLLTTKLAPYTTWSDNDNAPLVYLQSKNDIRDENGGVAMMASFFSIYIGSICTLAGAAILALKVMSEAIDSRERYDILKKMGCSDRELRCALKTQIGVYFALPVLLAFVHSLCGLHFMECTLQFYLNNGAKWGIILTMLVMAVFFGLYYAVTYRSSQRIAGLE